MRNDIRNEICNAVLKLWHGFSKDTRNKILVAGLKLWQELPDEEKTKVRAIITSLTAPTQGGSEE